MGRWEHIPQWDVTVQEKEATAAAAFVRASCPDDADTMLDALGLNESRTG